MATYTINVTIVPSGGGVVKVGSTTIQGNVQEEGDTVNLLALPSSGFGFVSYVIDGGGAITTSSYSFVMPASDVNVTATFEALPTPPNSRQTSVYDTSCPRFLMVKDMTDRFFEGDVVDMSVYDYTEVSEPIGFDSAEFVLERDENYHGFMYEFSDGGLSFERNSVGYEYLKTQIYTDGLDVDLKFVYGFGAIGAFTIFYIGKVDTSEFGEIEDGDKVEFSMKELDFDSLLQTAMEVVQPTTPDIDVLLYSKVIPKQVVYRVPRREQIEGASIESTYPSAVFSETYDGTAINYIYLNDGREGDGDLELFTTYDFQIDGYDPVSELGKYKYLVRAKLAGQYTFKINVLMRIEYNQSGTPEPSLDYTRLKIKKTESDGTTLVGSELTYAPTVLNADPVADSYIDALFEEEVTLNIELDQCVYLYFQILAPVEVTTELSNVGIRPFPNNSELPELAVEVQTIAPASKGKFIKPLTLLESTFSQAAQTGYTTVVSDFFDTDGCGEKLSLTNGFGVRGYQDGDRTAIKVSAKKLIDGLLNLFNLGWGVEYNVFKDEVVRIEPVEYFYQDAEIMVLDSISNYEKRVDSAKYYNEIEVGFAKYSKERETDKGNTLDDFHTKHLYQTPIKTNKNKLSKITDLTLSGYEIEILRRKQFEKDGKNLNGNFREDEDLFGVQLLNYTLFTGGTYTGILTDLDDYDIIYLGVNYMILRGFVPVYDGQQLDINVDSQGNVRVNVQAVQYDDFSNGSMSFTSDGTLIKFSNPIDATIFPVLPEVTISLVDGESYYFPESIQPFATTPSNMISPETGYNIRYTPKRMLYNWAKMFNGGFYGKTGTDEIVFKQGDGNVELSTQLSIAESCVLGDVDKDVIVENANVDIADIYNRGFIHLPYKVSFSSSFTFEQLTTLKDCLRGRADYNNYGYVTIVNSCGQNEKVYLTSVKYNPVIDEATFEGYLKEF